MRKKKVEHFVFCSPFTICTVKIFEDMHRSVLFAYRENEGVFPPVTRVGLCLSLSFLPVSFSCLQLSHHCLYQSVCYMWLCIRSPQTQNVLCKCIIFLLYTIYFVYRLCIYQQSWRQMHQYRVNVYRSQGNKNKNTRVSWKAPFKNRHEKMHPWSFIRSHILAWSVFFRLCTAIKLLKLAACMCLCISVWVWESC